MVGVLSVIFGVLAGPDAWQWRWGVPGNGCNSMVVTVMTVAVTASRGGARGGKRHKGAHISPTHSVW